MSAIEECVELLSQEYSTNLARLEETGGLPLRLVKSVAFDLALSGVICKLKLEQAEALLALSREKGLLQSTERREILVAALRYCYLHRSSGTT